MSRTATGVEGFRSIAAMADLFVSHLDSGPMYVWASVIGRGPFEHTFGGPPRHRGVTYAGCPEPVHLLYNFDLTDPALEFPALKCRWLPLYYAFRYGASPLWYLPKSDDQIEIVRQDDTEVTPDFPYPDYPREFPLSSATLRVQSRVEEYLAADDTITDIWEDCLKDFREQGVSPDHNDMAACIANLPQGAPQSECLNPACSRQRMDLLAVVNNDDVDGMFLLGRDGMDLRIYYEICPSCGMIHACAQCT